MTDNQAEALVERLDRIADALEGIEEALIMLCPDGSSG